MGIFDKLTFWKHDTTPSSTPPPDLGIGQDRTGLRSESGFPDEIGQSQDPFKDTTGLPTMDQPNPSFGQPAKLPTLEPIEETPASQPSAFGQLNEIKNPPKINQGSKDLEIIDSKVDTIKAMLENLTHKVEKIERIAEGEEKTPAKKYGGW